MKEAVTKVIDTLTQEDFHGAFQKLLERYNKGIAAGGDYFEGDSGSGRVDSALWMHHLDANKTAGDEARRQLHKNVASNIE